MDDCVLCLQKSCTVDVASRRVGAITKKLLSPTVLRSTSCLRLSAQGSSDLFLFPKLSYLEVAIFIVSLLSLNRFDGIKHYICSVQGITLWFTSMPVNNAEYSIIDF
jgi:hypothetical protein